MHSIFGIVELRRNYFYSPADGKGRFALDEALGLVGSFSPALVRLGGAGGGSRRLPSGQRGLSGLGWHFD
jgi:hypothetical protein